MGRFRGVEEVGGRSGRGEGRGDLLADETGLSEARDAQTSARGSDLLDGPDEGRVELPDLLADGVRLDLEDPPRRVEDHGSILAKPLGPRFVPAARAAKKGEAMIQRIARAAVLPFLVCALAVAGQASTPRKAAPKSKPAPQRNAAAAPTVAFEKYMLGNGLQVILHVDRKLPIVHVNQWFHVGSKNEKTGPDGVRPSLRAHDVPGLEERPRQDYFGTPSRRARTSGGGRQRHDQQRPHELLRDRALRQPRERALARVGPARDARRRR